MVIDRGVGANATPVRRVTRRWLRLLLVAVCQPCSCGDNAAIGAPGAVHAGTANATATGRAPPPPLATGAGHAVTAARMSRSARNTIESPGPERGGEIDSRPSAATDVNINTLNATVTVAAGTPK